MEVKIAAAAGSSLQWSHPNIHHHPHSSSPSPQALTASTSSSSSPSRQRKTLLLGCRYDRRTPLFGTKLHRSKSTEYLKQMKPSTIRRSCSANLDDSFPYDDFFPKIPDLVRSNDASHFDYFAGNQGREENLSMVPDGSSGSLMSSEETSLWNSFVEEAGTLQSAARDESLDRDTVRNFVSPAGDAKIQEDDYPDYLRTELVYRIGLTQDPKNSLLLANYAQFLFLVVRDYDRAEEYFKKATTAAAGDAVDAEAYNKYATFLWMARNDLWAAEETYLEAISADPSNTFYAANYAHFLWNTGGEDTCFPLDSSDESNMESSQHDNEA